jgi:hypothetical protein
MLEANGRFESGGEVAGMPGEEAAENAVLFALDTVVDGDGDDV